MTETRLRRGMYLSAAALGLALIAFGVAITRIPDPTDCVPTPPTERATTTTWVTVTENASGWPYIVRTLAPEDLDR